MSHLHSLISISCKVPQQRLLKLLEGFSDKVGMDCSIVPSKKHKGLYTVSTTDFFFPLIDDPYVMVCTFGVLFNFLGKNNMCKCFIRFVCTWNCKL
jgi:hypothetical protein